MAKTLGILVTSDQHGDDLDGIVLAAAKKGIDTCVHLEGSAVRICLQEGFHKVYMRARVSISRTSADRLGLTRQVGARYPGALTSSCQSCLNIIHCQRQIVL